MSIRATLLAALTLLVATAARAQYSNYPIQAVAAVQVSPPQVTLRWKAETACTTYTVSRKTKTATTWTPLGTISAPDTAYADATVAADSAFEYRILGNTATAGTYYTAYLYAGISAPSIHNRGALLVLVDSAFLDSCAPDLRRYYADAAGDGWHVLPRYAGTSASVATIKGIITTARTAHPSLKAVQIIGHLAVPYSGNMAPDGHVPDHQGAWPADVYYAGTTSTGWTDLSVNTTGATGTRNDNVPGDGKWDQTTLPSATELHIARLDFSGMPAFGKTEATLLKSYLARAHAYKIDSVNILKRALADDNFGTFSGEYFSANAWRGFPPLVGRDSVRSLDLVSTLNTTSYQWAYGCGGGSYTSCGGVGNTSDFVANNANAVFVPLFGSYFGDWDVENSFLRAPLCAPVPALASWWAGRPNWFLHHMALGESLGYSAWLSQNNTAGVYQHAGYGAGFTHAALLGDGTLRTDYRVPVAGLSVADAGGAAALSWTASTDPGVSGYYVYRADSALGPYTLVSPLVAGTSYTDAAPGVGLHWYAVRARALETTPSGTYYNLSLAAFDSASTFPPLTVVPGVKDRAAEDAWAGWRIHPNPGATLHITVAADAAGPTDVTVWDAAGRLVASKTLALRRGEGTYLLPTGRLPAGVYTVRVVRGAEAKGWTWVKE